MLQGLARDRTEIVEMTKLGMYDDVIAKTVGCTRESLRRFKRREGIKYAPPPASLSRPKMEDNPNFEAAMELSRMGQKDSEIAHRFKVDPNTIKRWRWRSGILKQPRRLFTEEARDRAEELLNDGASYTDTAKTVGFAISTVMRHFPGQGWTMEQKLDYLTTLRKARKQAQKVGIEL